MGNSFFVEFKTKVDGEVVDPLQRFILESGEIRKPSHNCRIMSQDMWWGAIGSSFTVFIGGILLILFHRGVGFIYTELCRVSNAQDSRSSILESGEIRKPSHNCRIMSQDMWRGAIGSSFTVFIGGILLILFHRGVGFIYAELCRVSNALDSRWSRGKNQVMSHDVVIAAKHLTNRLVLEKKKKTLTLEEIQQLNATETSKIRKVNLGIDVQEWAQQMISAQSLIGRGLVMMVFLLSFGSLFIYFVISIESSEDTRVVLEKLQTVDLGFNSFFLFYFGLRFIAANDKLRFWVELNSIVDFFTIPPVILSIYFSRDCIGLRFMRSLRLLQLPEILQYLRILKRHTNIKLASLLSVFVGAWLTAAGFIHTIENSGDPWREENNSQTLTYWQCVYLLMVTMSTVGYGDLTARTTVGQVFMVFFIILGLALFASHVPEIVELIGSHRKYMGSYRLVRGKKHIIMCGYITFSSFHEFLKDFTRKEREESSTDIVILEDFNPSLELQALFKRHVTQMQFFRGSVLKPSDLVRVQLDEANACLILADRNCLNPEAEDSANIMKAIAVKQYCPEMRIIAQVLQYHSKAYLQNLPSWNMGQRDSVICLSELKMGFIAQNCIVPGLSTLLANLFIKKSLVELKTGTWLDVYQEGMSQEIFTEFLSDSFVGMTFPTVCELCFFKLKLLLIAIQYHTDNESVSILINPDSNIVIQQQTLGFFIARKRTLVQRANIYCTECHNDIFDVRRIKKCACKKVLNKEKVFYDIKRMQSYGVLPKQSSSTDKGSATEKLDAATTREKVKVNLDSTGMFHWCPPKTINQVTLNRAMASRLQLTKHVIVCIFSEAEFPVIGLRNFVMPLRASSFTYDELKSIVFVVSLQYIAKEWETISNFPKVFILPGSPLCRADLKAASIGSCDMTVVISSNRTNFPEKSLQDKECILATLNLKAMLFEENGNANELSARTRDDTAYMMKDDKQYYRVPIITSLVHQSNVYFLDQEDRDDPDTDLYLTQPYASGSVFAFSILNALMCTTYFNDNILMLIRTLVTGGATPGLDEQLADEDALRGSVHAEDNVHQRNRCKLARITLCDPRFSQYAKAGKYGDLFATALRDHGILCFGIFRLQDPAKQSKKRFVITNPPSSFELNEMDFIMCTVPFFDTETMATNPYCQMNYSSKFIPLHAVARHSSITIRPVRFDRTMYTHDYAEQVHLKVEKDKEVLEKASTAESEEAKLRKSLEQYRERLKSVAMHTGPKERPKPGTLFTAVQGYIDELKGKVEPLSLKPKEVEVEVIFSDDFEDRPRQEPTDESSQPSTSQATTPATSVKPEFITPGATTPGIAGTRAATPGTATPGTAAKSGATTPETAGTRASTPGTPGTATPGTAVKPGTTTGTRATTPVTTVTATPGTAVKPGTTTPGTPGTRATTPVTAVTGTAVKPVTTTPGADVKPVTITPGADVKPVTTTPGTDVKPVTTTPGADVKPVTTTPGADVKPVTITPGADVKPVTTTPGTDIKPVTTTPGADVKPVTTTPGTDVKPVTTTPGADVKPVTTTLRTDVKPVTITPGADVKPVTTTPGADVKPVTTTPGADVKPVTTTPGTDVKPVTTTPGADVKPVTTTPGTDVKPVTTTPRADVKPVTTTPGTDVKPVTTTPGADVKPVTTTPGTDVKPVTTTPRADVKPVTTTLRTDVKPVTTTPGADVKAVTTTPGADVKPVTITPVADVKPVATTPGTDVKPRTTTPGADVKPRTTTPGTDVKPGAATPGTDGAVTPGTSVEPGATTSEAKVESKAVVPEPDAKPDGSK